MLISNVEADELLMQTITSIRRQDYVVKFNTGAILKNNRRHDKRGLIKQLARMGKEEGRDYTLELEYTYKSLDLAIFLVNKQLKKIQHVTKCDVLNLWLGPTDGSNFRFASAKTVPYKNNRGVKPEILTDLRNYLINFKDAQVIYGYEADDALGIYQKYGDEDFIIVKGGQGIITPKFDYTTIAVHCDKDIFMIPGLHYNTMTDKFVEVTEFGELTLESGKVKGNGLYFFYYQLLVGDATDTIPNMKAGFGPVKAYKALDHCCSEYELFSTVAGLYQEHLGGTWKERLLEQADLVWICRNKEEKGSDYIKRSWGEF